MRSVYHRLIVLHGYLELNTWLVRPRHLFSGQNVDVIRWKQKNWSSQKIRFKNIFFVLQDIYFRKLSKVNLKRNSTWLLEFVSNNFRMMITEDIFWKYITWNTFGWNWHRKLHWKPLFKQFFGRLFLCVCPCLLMLFLKLK